MAVKKNVCKFCRRSGEKLFLKGEKCFSQKCPMTRRNYAPGMHGSKRKRVSEYSTQLLEKQKLAAIYGLNNRQLHSYYQKAIKVRGQTTESLISSLERRLDNVIFRIGLARSRRQARKIIGDRHILLNSKRINTPSTQVKEKDEIGIYEKSQKNNLFLDRPDKDWIIASWLKWDKKQNKGIIIRLPSPEDIDIKIDTAKIIEFYSK
ncbi:30S ribosomal protein S4 [Patescibacteria group bacterium]